MAVPRAYEGAGPHFEDEPTVFFVTAHLGQTCLCCSRLAFSVANALQFKQKNSKVYLTVHGPARIGLHGV